jgi:UDP-N-acetylmuramate--alanine ligase
MNPLAPRPDWSSRRLHFIGIGGAGMSGLALVCRELGAEVTGSDRAESSYMERLRAGGIEPVVGHDESNLPEDTEVVVSTAIGDDNSELALARARGLVEHRRGELLAELCRQPGKKLIAVAGAHGKTTTSAMLAWALRGLGTEPAFFVGGEVPGLGPEGGAANAGWGEGEWVVAEADESDGSFRHLEPEIAVVTNVEMDHHAHWKSLDELTAAFRRFLESADAAVVPNAPKFPLEQRSMVRFAEDILYGDHSLRPAARGFSQGSPGPRDLRLAVPGAHNRANARAALAALGLAGFDLDAAAAGLADFPGVRRRLELKGTRNGATVYDDYAHHPTEVRAALEALREEDPVKLTAVFQPHLYSRTKELFEDFGAALALADEVFVLDIYAARENPDRFGGVTGKLVFDAASARMGGGGARVTWTPTIEQARQSALGALEPGAIVVTLGAGDVYRVADALVGAGDDG